MNNYTVVNRISPDRRRQVIMQGDSTPLEFPLIPYDKVDLSGSSGTFMLIYRNVVAFESTVSVDDGNIVKVPITSVLPSGIFTVEIKVGNYRFPSDGETKIRIVLSADTLDVEEIRSLNRAQLVGEIAAQVQGSIIDQEVDGVLTGKLDEFRNSVNNAIQGINTKYDELVQRGILQSNITEKLDAFVESQAPELANISAQLTQTADIVLENRNAKDKLPIPTYVFNDQAVHPSVVYIPNGVSGYKYWMAMTPYPSSNDTYENPSILASNDGMVWVVPAGLINPIDKPSTQEIADNKHMSDTHLIYVNGKLEVFYRLSTRDTAYDWIYRKTSTDGVNWSQRELIYESVSGGDYIISQSVVYDGIYKMWFVDMSGNIWYTTSVDLKTWSERTKINVDYHANYRAWHLDVQKIDNRYHLVINALRDGSSLIRDLVYVSSENETSFGKTKTLLTPSASGWDGGFLYRASLLKVDNHFKLYYSAFNNNVWGIGLISGNRIETMQDVSITRKVGLQARSIATDMLVGTNNQKLSVVSDETRYVTDKGTRPVIKLVESGVTGASLRLKNNGFDIYANNDTSLGGLTLGGLVLTSISSPNALIDFYKTPRIVSDRGTKPKIVFLESGVATSELRSGADAMEIGASSGANFGNLKLGKIIVSDSSSAPVEGAIRYNSTTKKHEGYNGTSWNPMY